MKPVPPSLLHRPFTFREAADAGVSARMLNGRRFVRIHPRVWRYVDHEMSPADEVTAARLAMPADAHLTGLTRIRMEGLDFGPHRPVRLVVARDHHIALDGIFLHRTKRLPPTDPTGVVLEAAFIAYCAVARTIDAIKVGDWLLHHGHVTVDSLLDLALRDPWRNGAAGARYVSNHLCQRSRSLPESETRALLDFAELPVPESNAEVILDDGRIVAGDLVYRALRLFIEYEGAHHQRDRTQYVADIDRYASLRHSGVDYLQVTKERSTRPQALVLEIHRRMVERGYDGPAPTFGDRWRLLFLPLSVAVADPRLRSAVHGTATAA